MLISHNKEVFDYANSVIPGITSVDGITEANKWSDRTKPVVSILTSLINKFAVNNGVYPNRILTTRDVWADIQANTEVQTMMGEMGRKVLTPETLLELIGLQGDDIPPVRVMRGSGQRQYRGQQHLSVLRRRQSVPGRHIRAQDAQPRRRRHVQHGGNLSR